MHLEQVKGFPTHLSHFMPLVSAYFPSKEKVEELEEDIKQAIIMAKEKTESIIVSQDTIDFFFVVHPSGTISLCCEMKQYQIKENH